MLRASVIGGYKTAMSYSYSSVGLTTGRYDTRENRCKLLVSLILLVVALIAGIGIGYSVGKSKYAKDAKISVNEQEERYKKHSSILMNMKADNMDKELRYLTEYPHMPGSAQNKHLAEYIAEKWRNSGFDKTEVFKYNILLSFPKQPGKISLLEKGKVQKKLVIDREPAYDDSEKKGDVVWPFNAFSAKGNVTGELVYGNHGTEKDFEALKSLGIDVRGKIMLLRYGKTARSYKVLRSELRGAIGVIIFSDPADYGNDAYPNGWMLNKFAVQRGTINRLKGDALSLGYPSKDNYFRTSKYEGNPTIPSQPISASTAYQILSYMKNSTIPLPDGFQGGLNLTYVLTSGKDRHVTLNVNTSLETKESYTVCTRLYGAEESDRYVMIGNHRDAWTYGAADPSSGTTVMMEVVRTLGAYKKTNGWRPRRSIMACSWGSEEPGVQGSSEWAEENHRFLMTEVVSYLNVDMAVEGNYTIRLRSMNSLVDGVFAAAKNVPAPDDKDKSLYEDWLQKSMVTKKDTSLTQPMHSPITSGSDYRQLWHAFGTPSADFRYYFNKLDFPDLPTNAQYHTRYDSLGWMSKHVDPGFTHHLAVGRLMAGHLLIMADATIIPLNLVAYTEQVADYLDELQIAYNELFMRKSISFDFAKERVQALITKVKEFRSIIKDVDVKTASPYMLRSINDKLMNFERNFLLFGIVEKYSTSHAVYASSYDSLQRTKFPGVAKAIFHASPTTSEGWDEVRKQLTLVVWCFDTAIRSLEMEPVKA